MVTWDSTTADKQQLVLCISYIVYKHIYFDQNYKYIDQLKILWTPQFTQTPEKKNNSKKN